MMEQRPDTSLSLLMGGNAISFRPLRRGLARSRSSSEGPDTMVASESNSLSDSIDSSRDMLLSRLSTYTSNIINVYDDIQGIN